MSSEPTTIRLLDREYVVGVDPDGHASLIAAARVLDGKMREVRGANRMAAVDRVAVLAALNLAHELQQLRDETERQQRALTQAVNELQQRVDGIADA